MTDEKFSDPFIEVADQPDPGPVVPSPSVGLVNLSTRAQIATGSGVLVPGFVIGGNGAKTLLIRGIGPELSTFGVPNSINAPSLTLYSGSSVQATNTG